MRIAIIEPYYGGSHKAWADGYRAHSVHDVVLFTHEARFWKWRMHGSYVTLAGEFKAHVESNSVFDVILASDMLHLPAFLGAIGDARGRARVALYMHENQLTYPLSPRDSVDEAYAMINWGSMTVADVVLFNSEFHRDAWHDAIGPQLHRFPDYEHSELLASVVARSEVLPVGVDLRRIDVVERDRRHPPLVLWNQRWDFDKGPDDFAHAVIEMASTHDFRLALAGEQIMELPSFIKLSEVLGERIMYSGFAADSDYIRLLRSADIVVSTAMQEFFGIAITEAVYAGAFPVVPNALVYPERIPQQFHDICLYEPGELASRLGWAFDNPERREQTVESLEPVMAAFDWHNIAPGYDRRLQELAG